MKKILHVVNDEKFIKNAIKVFLESSDDHHDVALIGKKKKTKHLDKMSITFINPILLTPFFRIALLDQYDAFIFHGLKGFKFNLLKKISKKKPIIWIGYGYDYYSLFNSQRKDFYLPETLKIIQDKGISTVDYKRLFRNFFEPSIDSKIKLLKKINFFNPVIYEEYYIFNKALGNIIPTYIDWNYPVLNDNFLTENYSKVTNDKKILIGNSNLKANNHVDAFKLIKLNDYYKFDEIIVPLSYGGSVQYKLKVKKSGEDIFGKKFIPLMEFLPVDEYFKILSTCKYFFSPTLRQQAFNNVLMMLFLEASVILYEENPIYSFLIKKGVHVFSEKNLVNLELRELTSEEKKFNKDFVINNYLEKAIIGKTKALLNKLNYPFKEI